MIAPVLQFHPSRYPNYECDTVIVACPICGGLHIHGAGDGTRGPHCKWGHLVGDYLLIGTEEAKARASRREGPLPNPYRSNRDLARQLLMRAPWSRLSLSAATDLIGEYVATCSDPQLVRSMSRLEFDEWLDSRLDDIAFHAGFVIEGGANLGELDSSLLSSA